MAQIFWEQIRNELPDVGEFLTGSLTVSGSFTTTGSLSVKGNFGIDGEFDIDGDLLVGQYIKHKGDDNTFINFTDNQIRLNAGGINFLSLEKDDDAPYPLTVNNGGNRVNFRVVDRNSALLLKTDSEAFKVNLYHAGNQKLETAAGGINITGNVTASQDIEAGRILKMVSQSITPTAKAGGIFYSSSNDYFFGFS